MGRDAGDLSALQAGALLAGGLFGGLVTDGRPPRSVLIAADLLRAALVFGLAGAGLLGAFDGAFDGALGGALGLPLLAAAAGAVALCAAAFDSALQATLPALTPGPDLRYAANALFDATRRAARILGPALVAAVDGLLPPSLFFAVTGAGFLLSAAAVAAALSGREGRARTPAARTACRPRLDRRHLHR